MSDMGKSRRKYITVEALDPESGTPCDVLISYDRMQTVGRRSLGHAKECAYIVPLILQRPSAIFEGLRRDEDEARQGLGWRCYCGAPEHRYRADGTEARPWSGQVFLVFVNDEHVAYNWRWEKCDPQDPLLPEHHESRFRRRLL